MCNVYQNMNFRKEGEIDIAGYKHPCRYCHELIPNDSVVCPFCGRKNPLAARCPKCHSPVEEKWKRCSNCGLLLEVVCPKCGRTTFFGDYCKFCDTPLIVVCKNPRCRTEQPPVQNVCIKCGKPLK